MKAKSGWIFGKDGDHGRWDVLTAMKIILCGVFQVGHYQQENFGPYVPQKDKFELHFVNKFLEKKISNNILRFLNQYLLLSFAIPYK